MSGAFPEKVIRVALVPGEGNARGLVDLLARVCGEVLLVEDLREIANRLPDFLLINLNGFDEVDRISRFTQLVRQKYDGPLATTPCLVVCEPRPGEADVVGWAAGVDAYLAWPFAEERLAEMVGRLRQEL